MVCARGRVSSCHPAGVWACQEGLTGGGEEGRRGQWEPEPEVREEPEVTQEPEVRGIGKAGFQGSELWEQKLGVSQESLESGGGSIWQSRDFDSR